MKPSSFAYHRPDDLAGALALLAEHGYDASVLAGGQSLVPVLSLRVARPTHVIDLNRIPGLDDLRVEDGTLVLGPMARQRAALESELVRLECPLLAESLEHVGHPETRNRGTVVGSLVHADPAAEIGAVAIACDAELVLRSSDGDRTERAADFLVGPYMTTKRPDELVVGLRLPRNAPGWGWSFQEIARRHHDFAIVGVAVGIRLAEDRVAEARIAVAGAGGTALRAPRAEELLRGAEPALEPFAEAAACAATELDPPTDVLATGAYRRHVASVLTQRSLQIATARARGER